MKVLCSRLRRTDHHLVELALLGLPGRLAKTFLRAVGAIPAQATNRANLRLSQSELANWQIVSASQHPSVYVVEEKRFC
jgi:hypothetical protein